MAKRALTVSEWWNHVGTANVMLTIKEAGTTYYYVRALKYRAKSCGQKTAEALHAAAQKITPGWAPSIELMTAPLPNREPKERWACIKPSPEFLRSQSRKAARRVSA